MRNFRFKTPINYRKRSQIIKSVNKHYYPDLARDSENDSENKPGDQSLFNTGKSLVMIVAKAEQYGSY